MISAVMPLMTSTNGYQSFSDSQQLEAIKQNFKFLLLTRPYSYVMSPTFGVGLSNFLFNLSTRFPESEIKGRIQAQVGEFMPYVTIKNIEFDLTNQDSNVVGVKIEFSIMQSAYTQTLNLSVTP